MARKSWTGVTPGAVVEKAVEVVKAVAGPIVRSVTASVPHRCDPTGWSCDCARRAEINSRSADGKSQWIPKRKGRWLK